MARRFDGTAPAHVRTALHLLRELDDQLHHGGFSRRDRFELVRLLTAARRQLRLAMVALERESSRARRWAVMTWVALVIWPTRALILIFSAAWAAVRMTMRMLRWARVMWP